MFLLAVRLTRVVSPEVAVTFVVISGTTRKGSISSRAALRRLESVSIIVIHSYLVFGTCAAGARIRSRNSKVLSKLRVFRDRDESPVKIYGASERQGDDYISAYRTPRDIHLRF